LLLRTGAIFIIENLDYERSHEYYLTVEATDGGTPSLSDMATVNINVTDINDNTPVFSQDTYTTVISEDAVLEQSVITVCDFFFPPYNFLLLNLCQSLW
jgi:protocadherin Fat 1/2/3